MGCSMTDIDPEPLRVLFLAAEADPLIKVGGLGDVAGSLPRALRRLSPGQAGQRPLDVRLALPFHAAIRSKVSDPLLVALFPVPRIDQRMEARIYQAEVEGVPVYLIDGPPFQEEAPVYLYDTALDANRYAFFSLAVLEMLRRLDWQPEILHANDWHTAISVYALHLWAHASPSLNNIRTVITVHNLPFMGVGAGPVLSAYGLPSSEDERLPDWARHLPLPLALAAADHITFVSPGYAKEVLTPEFGCGLQDFLSARAQDISGILNGLDQQAWNPATDPTLLQRYSPDTLKQRALNKRALREHFALPADADAPLMILIGRMDPQKGIDLALEALPEITNLPWQTIFLGTGDPPLEDATRSLEAGLPDRVRAVIRFDARLSRLLYAGADLLLMPSRYEPCGLAQMIAMRYGCVPLARATGGLRDTILDLPDPAASTGVLFEEATSTALAAAICRALNLYQNSANWENMQMNGMRQDFSWERSAVQYASLYQRLLSRPDAPAPCQGK